MHGRTSLSDYNAYAMWCRCKNGCLLFSIRQCRMLNKLKLQFNVLADRQPGSPVKIAFAKYKPNKQCRMEGAICLLQLNLHVDTSRPKMTNGNFHNAKQFRPRTEPQSKTTRMPNSNCKCYSG